MTVVQHEQGGEVEVSQRSGDVRVSSGLVQFAADGRAAFEMAAQLAPTPFVPKSYRWSKQAGWFSKEVVTATVAAAWLAGAEVGLSPMQSLQAIDVIDGRPALNALSMRALVQSRGHELWIVETSPEGAAVQALSVTMRGQRAGSDHVEETTWTWARARQAGLTGKTNWQNYPLAMLTARATAELCRRIAADVLMGLAYSSEELADAEEGAPAAEETVTVRRKQTPKPEPLEAPEKSVDEAFEEAVAELTKPEVQKGAEAGQATGPQVHFGANPGDNAETASRCETTRSDGARCERDAGHDGRHFYGRGTTDTVPEQPAPVVEQTPAVSTFEPSEEERAEQDEDDAPLFPEVSDEEQERAFLAEQAEREARAAQPVVEEPLAATQAPPADEEPDDPWAAFRDS